MNTWKLTKSRLSAVLVTAITAGLLGPVAVVSPAVAEEVVSSPAGTPNPSVAQMTGVSISGTLSYYHAEMDTSHPVTEGNGWIDLYTAEGWYETANPDAEGFYSFSDLPAGTYYLKAGYTGQDVESMPSEWYADKPSQGVATAVTVASTVVADRDIMLAPGGQISGTLETLVDDVAVPVAAATVCALSVTPTPALVEGEDYWCGTSGESGDYVISNLPNGEFRLYIDTSDVFNATGMTVGGGWIGASSLTSTFATAASQNISVTGGTLLTGRDATLVAPATISGVVKYYPTATSTVPLVMDGAVVDIYDLLGNVVGSTQTGTDGSYTIATMGPGVYYLAASDEAGLYPKVPDAEEPVLVAYEYFTDKPDLAVATQITMGSSNLTAYNLNLAYGASIKGKVTRGSTSTPAPGVEVCPFVTAFIHYGDCVLTDDAGNYDIAGLPNGSYKLYFFGEEVGLKNTWLGTGTAPVYSYATAIARTVSTSGLGVTAQNVTLVIPPSIKGKVTYTGEVYNDQTEQYETVAVGLPGATVEFYNSTTGAYVASVDTDENGDYTYIPEAAGSVRIFVDPSLAEYYGEGVLAPEWLTNVPGFSLATVVPFTTASVTGKNVHLAPAATISGSVFYESPETNEQIPVGGVEVCAYFSATEIFVCGTSDEFSGEYTIEGLPNGAYKLKFDTTDASVPLTTSWLGLSYNNPQPTYAAAATQTISTDGASLYPRDMELPLGTLTAAIPTITGTSSVGNTLTGNPGTWGPEGVELTYEWLRGTTVVGEELEYDVRPADMGSSLTFRVTGSLEFYTTASRTSAARAIPVVPSIRGLVTWSGIIGYDEQTGDPIIGDGGPLPGATVEFYNSTTGVFVDSVESDVDGSYTYIPAGSGSFKVRVDPVDADFYGEGVLAPEWFTNVPDISLATAIVFAGRALTGKNINLSQEASIYGSVMYHTAAEDTAVSLGDVEVCAYFSATLDPFACGTSDETGDYTIDGLPNGVYRLKFDTTNAYDNQNPSGPWQTSWLGLGYRNPQPTYALAATQTISTDGLSLGPRDLALPLGTLDTDIPTILGTPAVGSTLTGDPGEWGPEGVQLSYEWLRGTESVLGGLEYEVQPDDVGQSLTFKVRGQKELYITAERTSAAVIGGYAWDASPTPTITGTTVEGTAKFGQTLTANTGTWTPVPTSFTYQWLRGTTVVGTAQTYVLQAADIGHPMTVKVVGVKATYASSPQTSEPTTDVRAADYTLAPVPTITGSLNVGKVLTAVTGTWAPVPTSFTYQWRRGDENIGSATASTYTLTAADLGEEMSVVVTPVKIGHASTTRTSASSAAVAAALFTTAPVPTITGTVKVGNTLTGVPGTWSPAVSSGDFGWVWSISSSSTGEYLPIDGATTSTYVLRAADLGKFVKVTATGKKAGYVDTPRSSLATIAVAAATFTTIPVPTVSGTAKVGETLTANEGTWSPTTDSYTYVWSSSATATGTYAPISGATSRTYELTSADRGKFVKVAVTGVKAGFTSATSLSAVMTSGVVAAFTTAPTPTITGTVRVGQTLTAVPGSWSPVPAFTYQWKRTVGSVTTNIATTATYVLTAADYDAVISVVVTGTLLTYETTAKTSGVTEAVAAGVFTTAPTPTITGSAQSGQTLTAVPGTWAPVATFTYQWLADEEVIAGKTLATYVVTADMVGKQISVAVTGAATRYTSQTKTSAATAAVTLPLIPAAPTPVISGTVKFGNTLTVAPGTLAGATVKSTQWSSAATLTGSFTPIEGATSSTYALTASDVTRFIRATVTWQKSGNGDTPKTSATTVVVAAGTFATPPIPTITGTKTVGSTLTANRGTWTTAADTYSYTWSRASGAKGPFIAIGGATAETYTLTSADLGKLIKVTVTGVKAGYTSATSLSAATTAVAAGPSGGTTFTVTNSGAGTYTINGATNPTFSFLRGHRYVINVSATGHPFWIQTVAGAYSSGNIYNTGVTNNGAQSGTIIFEVPYDAPNNLYYVCQYHSSMAGSITVLN